MIDREVLSAALAEADEYLADSTGVLMSKDSPILVVARLYLACLEGTRQLTAEAEEDWATESDGSMRGQCGGGTWRLADDERTVATYSVETVEKIAKAVIALHITLIEKTPTQIAIAVLEALNEVPPSAKDNARWL